MKLSGPMRASVVEKALHATFSKRWKDLLKNGERVGDAAIDMFAGSAKAAIKKADEAGFCRRAQRQNESYMKIGSAQYVCNVDAVIAGQRMGIMVSNKKPVPVKNDDGYERSAVILNHAKEGHTPHITAVQKWHDELAAINTAYHEAKNTLEAMLKGLTTYAKLEEQWPEGRKFYQSLPVDFPYQHNVPAVQVSELNKMLGIAA